MLVKKIIKFVLKTLKSYFMHVQKFVLENKDKLFCSYSEGADL